VPLFARPAALNTAAATVARRRVFRCVIIRLGLEPTPEKRLKVAVAPT
jgi:hypothetical protein